MKDRILELLEVGPATGAVLARWMWETPTKAQYASVNESIARMVRSGEVRRMAPEKGVVGTIRKVEIVPESERPVDDGRFVELPAMRRRVMRLVADAGPDGLAWMDAVRALGLTTKAARAQLDALNRLGLVRDNGSRWFAR